MLRILICHRDAQVAENLSARLMASQSGFRIHRVRNLTEAYNITEHRLPDCLLIEAFLADAPEAELLFALAKLLRVQCIRLGPAILADAPRQQPEIPSYAVDTPLDMLLMLVKQATGSMPSRQPVDQAIGSVKAFDERCLILIGASTGGIDALIRVLRHWTPDAPPTLIVQHTGSDHMPSLIRLLNGVTTAEVRGAHDRERLQAGRIYLAMQEGAHLCLMSRPPLRASMVKAGPVSGHCPSVDMLFSSAEPFAEHVAAALLTGMGRDGAEGLVGLRAAGAKTFGQDAATSVVYGMPRIAKEWGGVQRELPIDRIGPALLEASRKRTRAA